MYDTVMGSAGVAKHHVAEGAKSIRAGGEAGLVGAVLGAAHASLPQGLDVEVNVPSMGVVKMPMDGAGAILGLGGAILLGQGSDHSSDVRNAGAACMAILTFRKTASYVHERRALAGLQTNNSLPSATHHGEESSMIGEDSIVRAARRMANAGR
jgi:hypothetical protein